MFARIHPVGPEARADRALNVATGLYKAPTDYTKPQKDYTKTQNIRQKNPKRQQPKIFNKSSNNY